MSGATASASSPSRVSSSTSKQATHACRLEAAASGDAEGVLMYSRYRSWGGMVQVPSTRRRRMRSVGAATSTSSTRTATTASSRRPASSSTSTTRWGGGGGSGPAVVDAPVKEGMLGARITSHASAVHLQCSKGDALVSHPAVPVMVLVGGWVGGEQKLCEAARSSGLEGMPIPRNVKGCKDCTGCERGCPYGGERPPHPLLVWQAGCRPDCGGWCWPSACMQPSSPL